MVALKGATIFFSTSGRKSAILISAFAARDVLSKQIGRWERQMDYLQSALKRHAGGEEARNSPAPRNIPFRKHSGNFFLHPPV
jgi:hypothetical protein